MRILDIFTIIVDYNSFCARITCGFSHENTRQRVSFELMHLRAHLAPKVAQIYSTFHPFVVCVFFNLFIKLRQFHYLQYIEIRAI